MGNLRHILAYTWYTQVIDVLCPMLCTDRSCHSWICVFSEGEKDEGLEDGKVERY